MTYADLYDQWLDELYQSQLDKIDFLRGVRAGRLIREIDPTMYNCGFNDWSDGLENVKCPECGNDIADELAQRSSQDAEVICGVCVGDEFECSFCGETLPIADQSQQSEDCCGHCWIEKNEEDEDE